MKLSGERILYLSDIIARELLSSGDLGIDESMEEVKSAVVRAFNREVKREEEIEERVRAKIASLSRNVQEGSSEWEVLYHKYYEEEMSKRKRVAKSWNDGR